MNFEHVTLTVSFDIHLENFNSAHNFLPYDIGRHIWLVCSLWQDLFDGTIKALSHVANIWPTKIMINKLWWILFYFANFEQGIIISSCVVHLFQNRMSKAAWYGVKPATVRYFRVILVKRWSLHKKMTFIGCLADKFYCVKWWSIERTLRIDKNIYPREIQ